MTGANDGDASPLETARAALALAKRFGAESAAASSWRSRDLDVEWRDGQLDKVGDAVSRTLALQLYAGGRYGSVSTSDLRPEALARFVESSVAMVRAIAPDPYRRLPDPALYEGRSTADLEVFDKALAELPLEARLERLKAAEAAARAHGARPVRDRILSVSARSSDNTTEAARVASNGFEGTFASTQVSSSVTVSVKDDDGRRPTDWASATVRHVADLPAPEVLGKEATERAAGRLGAKKIGSGAMSVLVEARAAGGLLRHLLGPLGGGALQQRESFFEGKLGARVASPLLSLIDDPLMRRGLGSRPYDGEGIALKQRPLFDAGVLRAYLIDVYYAGKLKTTPTSGATTNLVLAAGKKSLDELTADMKNGILVTGFLGGNSNATTGIFSLGIAGVRIVNGKRAEAIGEMNIAGSHLDFWKRLAAVGRDPYPYSTVRAPALLFEGVSVAGT